MKSLSIILVILVWIFIAAYVFNHVNSWIGIAFAIGGLAFSLFYLENKFKNKEKK
jgi:membrane associated rhomboid family serine protease